MRVSIAVALIFAGLGACSASQGPQPRPFIPRVHERVKGLAPLYGEEYDTKIPDDYIVKFKESHTHHAHFNAIGNDYSNSSAYHHYSYGYTMNLSDSSLMNSVRKDPGVLLVETNRQARLPEYAAPELMEESDLPSMSRHVKRYVHPEHGAGCLVRTPDGCRRLQTFDSCQQ